jgi:hypothetical protein|tara:strand:- start:720 stop:1013 length:294 start_codon:yes stop_codon:yes gene_type:complete
MKLLIVVSLLSVCILNADTYYTFYQELTPEQKRIYVIGVIDGFESLKVLIEQDKWEYIRHIEIDMESFLIGIEEGIEPDVTSRIVREIRGILWYNDD